MERKYEELKNNMKALQRQYDQLLEKNQNDLIRINKKEKQLDQIINELKIEKQTIIKQLTIQIEILKEQLLKQRPKSLQNLQTEAKSNTSFINQIQNENISLRAQIENQKKTIQDILQRNKILSNNQQLLNDKITSLLKENSISTNQEISRLKNMVDLLEKQINQKQQNSKILQDKNAIISKELEQLKSQYNRKYESLVLQYQAIKEEFLKEKDLLIGKIKLLENDVQRYCFLQKKPCQSCVKWQQNNILTKQMLKSTQMMLKFKQMELEKVKNK